VTGVLKLLAEKAKTTLEEAQQNKDQIKAILIEIYQEMQSSNKDDETNEEEQEEEEEEEEEETKSKTKPNVTKGVKRAAEVNLETRIPICTKVN